MSTRSASKTRSAARRSGSRAGTQRAVAGSRRGREGRRRRVMMLLAAVAVGVAGGLALTRIDLGETLLEVTLPLRHDDIIRQQAADKDLDPALIAAVIYSESRFHDQTSHAGARGLMQITPETADAIAKHSGGTRFKQSDLATPQINISYGAYYLRLLIDHFGGNETLAIAA